MNATPPARPAFPSACRALLSAFILAALVAVICWSFSGYALDLFLAPALGIALLTPPLAATARRLPDLLGIVFGLSLGPTCLWLLFDLRNAAPFQDTTLCGVDLFGIVAANATLVRLFIRCRMERTVAAALITTLAAVWLVWPLWATSPVPLLVRLHPLLAMNGILASHLGVWTEQPVAYRWISFGQDLPYALPQTIWHAFAAHMAVVGVAAGLSELYPARLFRRAVRA